VTTITPEIEARARDLVGRMTPAERLRMLSGDQDIYRDFLSGVDGSWERRLQTAAGVARLGLTGLRFVDGPRGVALGLSTCFPVAIARAATFDYDLEERVGEAIGREARAHGANWCGAPCLNLLRHPG
jgi:beta-glucosidase